MPNPVYLTIPESHPVTLGLHGSKLPYDHPLRVDVVPTGFVVVTDESGDSWMCPWRDVEPCSQVWGRDE